MALHCSALKESPKARAISIPKGLLHILICLVFLLLSLTYRYGFFSNKRIVLFDTLINSCTEEEVVGVLAHELGE